MGEETATQSGQNARQLQAESHDDRAFDTMLRLLIMMEGELQTKEAIIEMLMEGHSKDDDALMNKLNKFLGVRETDPFSALKRDGIYSHQKWTELFVNDNERDRAVLADSSRYLSACSSLRAISVARLQNQRYSEAYEMLQKTVKNYRKLKVKYTKERRKTIEIIAPPDPLPQISPANDVTDSPASTIRDDSQLANQVEEDTNLAREQERCRGLEEKVEQLTQKMAEEERQRMSIEKQMRDEIRRLHRELKVERENNKKGHCRLFITTRRADQPADKSR